MMKSALLIISLALNLALGALSFFLWPIRIGELANYEENSLTQAVFDQADWNEIQEMKVVVQDGYQVALIKRPAPVALLLNSEAIPTIKIYPPARIVKISVSEVEDILKDHDVSPDVEVFIRNLAK